MIIISKATSDFSTIRKMSLMNMLKGNRPNTKPHEIPRIALAKSLKDEPIFVLCLRKSK